ncbi:MAG TPA: DUF885 domain-containing protein [Gammaproteobacteria bacterium]
MDGFLTRKRAAAIWVFVGLVFAAVSAPVGAQPQAETERAPAQSAAANAEWDAFVEEFIEAFFAAHPAFAVTAGRHEYDGRLPDWSADGIAAEIARLRAERERALAFRPEELDARRRFEREYLIARMDRDLFWLETAEWPFRSPSFYFDWLLDSLDPNVYIARPYAPAEQRLRAFTAYAEALPAAAEQIRDNLRTPLPRTYIDYGAAAFGGLAAYFESDVRLAFADVNDPALEARFDAALEDAVKAMEDLAGWLEDEREEATDEYALGSAVFAEMVWATERVDVSLARLEEVGREDLERNFAALTEACEALAPGEPLHECVAMVAADKPEGGPVAEARRQLGRLREFVAANDIASIPGTEEAHVEEAPPYNRQNFAYIDIPGPYETGLPSVYYIAPPDPNWPPEEQAAYVPGKADLLFTSVHEVWPGHFLHFLHTNRLESPIARLFVGYAFAEGWAHYAEEMMVEAGLGEGDPSVRVGQILNALLRDVRFLSAIGLHTGGMTVEESERMFVEKAFQDPGNARQQAARGTYDPAYLDYTLGKLMIRRLREDWTAGRGGREAWCEFHDAFLSYGGPPIPLVRRAMLGEEAGPAL